MKSFLSEIHVLVTNLSLLYIEVLCASKDQACFEELRSRIERAIQRLNLASSVEDGMSETKDGIATLEEEQKKALLQNSTRTRIGEELFIRSLFEIKKGAWKPCIHFSYSILEMQKKAPR